MNPLTANHPHHFPGTLKMRNRSSHNRQAFQWESLEIRNAPSHFGGLPHAAVALHHAHTNTPAQVRHLNDPQSTDQNHQQETPTGVDQSRDHGVDTASKDPQSDR
jgi:hypothetical protein